MAKVIIGIDIGTTSTKGILYQQDLAILATKNYPYHLYQDNHGMAEQEPVEIFKVVLKIIKELSQFASLKGAELVGVSFSSAMHSLIVMDQEDQPLTRSITWLDNRASQASELIKNSEFGQAFYERSGTPIHSMSPMTKIAWLKAQQLEIFSKAKKFIGIKEYIFYQLFGIYVSDYSIASATGLLNLKNLAWDEDILAYLSLSAEQLPTVVPPETAYTALKEEYQTYFNFPNEVAFIIGGSDGCLASLGSGAKVKQEAILTVGTSSALRMISDEILVDPAGRTFCYALSPDRWVIGGASNNGGAVFQWAKELVQGENEPLTYERAIELAAQAPLGANDLTFLPYLGGERAPLWQASARGHLLGLSYIHQPGDILRSVLEGIFYNLADILSLLEELTGPVSRVIASGGLLQAPFNQALAANILARPLVLPESVESSCLGAAMVGFDALNLSYPELSESDGQKLIQPSAQNQYIAGKNKFKTYQSLLNN